MSKTQDFQQFPNQYIDDIKEDPDNNYFTPVIHEALKHVQQPERVCDIGCGNGVFSIQVKRLTGCHLTGVDGNEYALDQARKLGFDVIHQVLDFSSERLPIDNETYDMVICKDVLEHLLNPEYMMREIARIVKKMGGYVLLHVPNHFTIVGRLKLLLTNNIDPFNYFPDANRWDFPHIRFFTHKSLLKLSQEVGLKCILNLSHHFKQLPIVHRFIPHQWQKNIVNKYTDALSEGITMLLKRQ